jgi:ectoine hydroxylase-related dioxygenase (phytanoyl-CoA dioxygenase family)
MELGRSSYSINTAHLRFRRIYELVQHPRIVAPVADLLGPNVVCWGSHFFCKLPHDGKRVPWHQDSTYWPLTPTKTVTVWLAIDDADPENANMKFIPRSHLHGLIDYDETDDVDTVLNLAVKNPHSYGDGEVDVQLTAGQFSMHSDLLLHGSEANESDRRRCGLTIRYAAADVRTWFGWNQKGIVVSGVDSDHHWSNRPAPAH